MSENRVMMSPETGVNLTDQIIGEIVSPIPHGHRSNSARWFASEKACEFDLFPCDENSDSNIWKNQTEMRTFILENVANAAKSKFGIDAAIIPAQNRRVCLLIADMDSTIIEQECIDELADLAGIREEISNITERAMRGELDFEGALRERVARLKGLPESALQEAFEKKISLTPGARALVQTMKARGAVTALVSGGFTYFTSRVAHKVGFDINQANELMIKNGKLTGMVAGPILGRAAKQDALTSIAKQHKIPLAQTLAVGDGANDLSMLEAAGLGVAYHAKPAVAEAADARIDHGDLTALLYLQGIPESDFVTD